MDRRQFCGSALLTMAAGFGGCLFGRESGNTRISDITLNNVDDTEHTIDVRIEREGETVYENTFKLASTVGPEDSTTGSVPLIDEKWMDRPGTFTVMARLKTDEDWYSHEFPRNSGSGCYGIEIKISPGGLLSIPYSGDSSHCSTDTSRSERVLPIP